MERFEVKYSEEVREFLRSIDEKARHKIAFNIDKVKVMNDKKLFTKLTHNIWEFRTLYGNKQYRIFAFWDRTEPEETLVIATHGIIKKTQKTPKKEIKKAIQIRHQYFKDKGL